MLSCVFILLISFSILWNNNYFVLQVSVLYFYCLWSKLYFFLFFPLNKVWVDFDHDWFLLLILFEIYLGGELPNEWGLWKSFPTSKNCIFSCSVPQQFSLLLWSSVSLSTYVVWFLFHWVQLFFITISCYRKGRWVWKVVRPSAVSVLFDPLNSQPPPLTGEGNSYPHLVALLT